MVYAFKYMPVNTIAAVTKYGQKLVLPIPQVESVYREWARKKGHQIFVPKFSPMYVEAIPHTSSAII